MVDILNDEGEAIPLFVHKSSSRKSSQPTGRVASLLQDEPTRVFVPILLRPLVMHVPLHMDLIERRS